MKVTLKASFDNSDKIAQIALSYLWTSLEKMNLATACETQKAVEPTRGMNAFVETGQIGDEDKYINACREAWENEIPLNYTYSKDDLYELDLHHKAISSTAPADDEGATHNYVNMYTYVFKTHIYGYRFQDSGSTIEALVIPRSDRVDVEIYVDGTRGSLQHSSTKYIFEVLKKCRNQLEVVEYVTADPDRAWFDEQQQGKMNKKHLADSLRILNNIVDLDYNDLVHLALSKIDGKEECYWCRTHHTEVNELSIDEVVQFLMNNFDKKERTTLTTTEVVSKARKIVYEYLLKYNRADIEYCFEEEKENSQELLKLIRNKGVL